MKKIKPSLMILLLAAISFNQTAIAQSSTATNNFLAGRFLGWGTTSGDLEFRTNNTNRMVVKNNTGFVGIGNGFTTPNQLLTVNGGNINAQTANQGYMINNNYVLWHNGNSSNIYVAVNAGNAASTGINNTFVGYGAGNSNTSANSNAFFGFNAGTSNTTGSQNTFLGNEAGTANTTGYDNTYVGDRAGQNNSTGIQNTFIGHHAGASFFAGNNNVAIGWHATFGGGATANGSNNTIVGTSTIIGLTTGSNNCLLGYNVGNSVTIGSQNCFMGTNTGNAITTGTNNIFIGSNSNATIGGISNSINLGTGTIVRASNKMILGNNSIMVGIGLSNDNIQNGPQNKLEINAGTGPSGGFAQSLPGTAGVSGLRFRDLHAASATATNPGAGVLAVDVNGDVIYVKGGTGIGNYCGATPTNPLTNNYEIPLAGFDYFFSGQNTPNDNRVAIGLPCGTTLPPAKLSVLEQSVSTVSGIPTTIAGAFANRDIPATTFPFTAIAVYGISDATQISANQQNVGGSFRAENSRRNIGVWGRSVNPLAGASKFGVYGEAIGGGANYSIYGTSSPITTASATNTSWAVYSNGAAYYTTAYSPSDGLIKKDIASITGALDIINHLNPIKFNFDVNLGASNGMNLPNSLQYGFKAQDVEQVLPELVTGVQNPAVYDSLGNEVIAAYNFKALNYNAFIGILAAGIKEQQAQLNNKDSIINVLKTNDSVLNDRLTALENCINALNLCGNPQAVNQNNSNTTITAIPVELSDAQAIVLEQNVPNPFAEQTTINYFLPETVTKAQMLFYNAQGKLIQSVELSQKGKGSINVFAQDLSSGIYTYTLVADGKIVETKKMIKQ